MKRAALIVAAAAVPLAGCGGDGPRPPTSTLAATPTPAATEALPSETAEPKLPPHRTLRFRASDGKRLKGSLTPAAKKPAPAVILVHQYQGGPDQWQPLIGPLHRAGFTTLAYASRSAGELDERKLARDVEGAVRALRRQPEVDPGRIALAGASIGATTVAYVLGTDPGLPVRGGVGLSAVESPTLINLGTRRAFKPHDLLLIADDRELIDARNITMDAHGNGITAYKAPTTGHGVALFPNARVRAKLIGWLKRVTS